MFPAHCLRVLHECVRGPELKAALLDSSCRSQAVGVNFPFLLWTFLKVPCAGGGWRPGDRELPAWVHGGASCRQHHSLCGLVCFLHANTLLPACVHACVHVPVHASPLDASLAAGAGASVGMSRVPLFSRPLFSHRFYSHSHSHQIPHGPETPRLQGVL